MRERRRGLETKTSDNDVPVVRRGSSRHTNGGRSSASLHSAVFAEDVDDNDQLGQGNRAADQKILDNARFGLAKVHLRSSKSTTRRTSAIAGVGGGIRTSLRMRSSSLAKSWVGQVEKRVWKRSLAEFALTCRLLDSLYILFIVPLRLGFFFDPWNEPRHRGAWNDALTAFTIFDLAGVVLHAWFTKDELRPHFQRALRYSVACCLRRVSPLDKPRLMSVLRASFVGDGDMLSLRSRMSGLSGRDDRMSAADALPFRQRKKSSHRLTATRLLSAVFNCFPLELVLILALRNYNFLHIVGVTRFPQAVQIVPRLFADVVMGRYRHLRVIQALSFSSIASIAYLFVIGVYLVHAAASLYMLVAHWECGLEFDKCASSLVLPGTWVQKDRLEHGTLWRKYIRSLYWGSKTVTTLGQGDLVPATEAETVYRILVQFISGLWATAILTAYSFYFSRKDAKMTTNLTTRLEQAGKFVSTRRLPDNLSARVQTYFDYMQRSRFGLEEEATLRCLPSHYEAQCLNYVKYRSLQRLPLFKNRDGAFLRSILKSLRKDYFAPSQIVVNIGDAEEMFVVAKGEINVVDGRHGTVGRLTPGNAHAEKALFMPTTISQRTLIAETHCEIWALQHVDFKVALKQHYSKLKYAGIMTSRYAKADQQGSRLVSMSSEMAAAAQKFRLHDPGVSNKLLRKMSTTDSLRNPSTRKKSGTWRFPNSQFRRVWQHVKCVILLLQIYEVPYHIAFQRGFGFLNAPDFPILGAIPRGLQELDFAVTFLFEMFFLADWFFRARLFCRYVVGNESTDAASSSASFGLIRDPSMIFRHYRENDNVYMDIVEHLPLPLVWDILPKQHFSSRVIYVARGVRLLRFMRLQQFHLLLRSIMIDHALSPSKRLLVHVVICCTATAHIAACLFFLLADYQHFQGGLPVGGVHRDSMTAFDCLQDTTVFRNCTWYIYDRSMYDMDAPFLRALQWSIVLQSTVGYGEIMSFSSRECVIGCLWIFLGANICYCTGCVLSSVLAQLNIQDEIQRERMEDINLALIGAPNLSENTKTTVRSYYDSKWELNGCAKRDQEILTHLPRSVRREIRESLHAQDLGHCYLFAEDSSETPSSFIRALAQIARCEIFLTNVMVVREGHLATEFFVLQRGEVELLLAPLSLPVSRNEASGSPSRGKLTPSTIAQRQPSNGGKFPWTELDFSLSLDIIPRGSAGRKEAQSPSYQSRSSVRESSRASAVYSRVMKVSAIDFRLSLPRLRVVPEDRLEHESEMIPIAVLQRHDCFGEESLTPQGSARTYQVNVRVVASAQIVVIRRGDLFVLAPRFPAEFKKIFALLEKKADQDAVLYRALETNFMFKEKVAKRLGIPKSLYVDRTRLTNELGTTSWKPRFFRVVDPEEPFARWWYRIVSGILVYNFYVVIFRIAFLPKLSASGAVWLTSIEYVFDLVLYADIAIKYGWLGYIEHGAKVMDKVSIRDRYRRTWFKQDCWSMLPLLYHGDYFVMALCRLPRLLRSPQLLLILDDVQTQILQRFLRGNNTKLSSVFDLFRFVLIFISTAHYVGSLYYLLGRLQLEWGFVDRSWINFDFVLLQYPDNVWVRYMRSMYWCLSTFTVDCFGDIVARNVLETVFSMSTCILGWVFIGQVIGRINLLMITLDKEAKQHQMRIEDFDQYAKQRKLPHGLRHRATQSISFKSECLISLRLREIFYDLPKPLQIHLFGEMYAPILRPLPELNGLSNAQIEAIASVLYLEIYLPGDVIFECGRVGTKLFLMKHGCAEVYSPGANTVFAAVESGMLFGECAFFIPGAKRLASTRAVRSCQVLQLDRHQWDRLWPKSVRAQIEAHICKLARVTYLQNARSYLSMAKNFYIKNENARPQRSISQRALFARHGSNLTRPPRNDLITRAGSTTLTPTPTIQHGTSFSEMFFGTLSRPSSPKSSASPSSSPSASSPNPPPNHAPISAVGKLVRRDSDGASSHGSGRKFVGVGRSSRSVTPSHGSASLQRQSSQSSNVAQAPAAEACPVTVGDTPRHMSPLIAFAEAIGLRDQLKSRPTSALGRLPPLASVPSDRQLMRRESRRGNMLPKLSASTELKWKRHEKRLAAIRMFYVSYGRAEKDLESLDGAVGTARRASISEMPDLSSFLDEERARLRTRTAPRRFSMQVDERSLREELLAFDPFDNEDAAGNAEAGKTHGAESWNDQDEDDDAKSGELRSAPNADSSGSFTVTTFLREITMSSRRSLRRKGRNKVTPMEDIAKHAKSSHEIWVPPASGPEMFREDSRFRQKWDTIMLFVTVYYGLVVPFRACFVHDHMDDPRYGLVVSVTFAVEYLFTDVPCMLDFVMRRNHFEFIQDGERISDQTWIQAHYWHDGTCVMDLVALFPLELVALGVLYLPGQSLFSAGFFTREGALPVWRTLAFARANRSLRALVHLHPLSDRVQRFLLYDVKLAWLRPSLCYVVRLALDFALGTHWIACFFFGASYLLHVDGHPSWLTTPGMLVFDDSCQTLEDVSHVRVLTKYLRSFHFSIGAVTTVCYGDILPMNALENTATILVIFVSVALFSMLSGGFFKFFEMEFGKRADYEEKVSQVGQLMVFHQFPSRTWKQMQVYFALSWQESKGMQQEEMLRGLTRSMRNDIAAHVHANLLKHVKLLSTCEARFARALLAVLQHELYVRNDAIIQRGDRGRSMYIIESGLVSIRRPETKKHRPSSTAAAAAAAARAPPPDGHANGHTNVQTASTRLRGSKLLVRDVKAGAMGALAAAAHSGHGGGDTGGHKKRFVPESPSDAAMLHAIQQSDRELGHGASQFAIKLKVEPKMVTRSASAILVPDAAAAGDSPAGAARLDPPIKTAQNGEGSLRGGGQDVRFVKGAFDYFGERSLLFGTPRIATCVALCVCSIYVLTLEEYEKLLEEFPQYRRKNIQDWVMTGSNEGNLLR